MSIQIFGTGKHRHVSCEEEGAAYYDSFVIFDRHIHISEKSPDALKSHLRVYCSVLDHKAFGHQRYFEYDLSLEVLYLQSDRHASPFSPEVFQPFPGQGHLVSLADLLWHSYKSR